MTPQLDHYLGRTVATVDRTPDNLIRIMLDGGVEILDENIETSTLMPQLVGGVFQNVTFSADETVMHFDKGTYSLSPLNYRLSDPERPTEVVNYPQRVPPVDVALPPDPSDERVSDGPTGPEDG